MVNKEEIEKELKKNLNELAGIENTPETLKKIRETIQNVLDNFIFKEELYYKQFPIELQNDIFSLKIEANGNAYIIPKKATEFIDLNFSISKTPPTNHSS